MIRQPRVHHDYEAGELAGGVANHVGAQRRSQAGSLEAQQRDGARVEPGRMQRLMGQADRTLRQRLIELGARGAALFEHQRFVASERAQPVAGRSLAGGKPQIAQQIANRAASLNRDSGGSGSSLQEMEVRIDEAGSDGAAGELDQMSSRTDQRLQLRKRTVRGDQPARDGNRVATGVAEDQPLVKTQVGFRGRDYHFGTHAFVACDRARRRTDVLVGTWKRLGFLDLHLDLATLEAAGASLVAEHLSAAFFALVTLTEHVSHRNPLLEPGPCGPSW